MTTLYRVYDDADRLLYVGITDGHPFVRLSQHPTRWVDHAVKVTLERYTDRETARDAELSAIRDEDPVWNIDGRPVQRFMQWMAAYPDKHADDISPERLEELANEADRTRIAALLRVGGAV